MTRLFVIVAAAFFCLLAARTPDPRVRAAFDALEPHHHDIDDTTESGFYCPMDLDVRSPKEGRCARCGMALVKGIPELIEYPLDLKLTPAVPRAEATTRLTFALTDPRTQQSVRRFEIVHEKLYHAFVVSEDLQFFRHDHPERSGDEDFHLDVTFPKPGLYRVLSDFYPTGGSPQLIASTVIVPGAGMTQPAVNLQPNLAPKQSENAAVALTLPTRAIAGARTTLRFSLSPRDGLEPYLGTWGHMLSASSDLIDMVHAHPLSTSESKATQELDFSQAFPRPGMYRVWLQFQRKGIVNTVSFDVPVAAQ